MKKIVILLFMFTAMLNSNLRAETTPDFYTYNYNVCPNGWGKYSCKNVAALPGIYAIRFQCGGAGYIENYRDNPQNLYVKITGGQIPSTCIVNWTNAANNTNSWVTITVYYDAGAVPHTFTVNIGIQANTPGGIITENPVCSSFSGSKTASCNPLPVGATGYEWYSPNTTISGNGQTITYNVSANTADIVLMVRYIASCGGYSNWSSITIPRTAPNQTPQYKTREESFSTLFTFLQVPRGTAFQASNNNPNNWYSFNGSINVLVNQPKVLYVRSKNACGTGPAGYYYLEAFPHVDPFRLTDSNKESILENNISIYPTPASNNVIINISSDASASYSISLSDVLGKQVLAVTKAVEPGANESTIDVSNLENGAYFLTITDGINRRNEKIIVSH